MWKLKHQDDKEIFTELLKTKSPKAEIQSVEEEWDRLKVSFIETTEEVCG